MRYSDDSYSSKGGTVGTFYNGYSITFNRGVQCPSKAMQRDP